MEGSVSDPSAPISERYKATLWHTSAAFAGGVLALAVILVAPATSSRVGGSPADFWLAIAAAIATAAYQVVRLLRYFPLTCLMCVFVPAVIGCATQLRITQKWLWITSICVAITLPFCYFPSFYAQNGNPPARSLIVPGAILIGYLVFIGFALQPSVQRILDPRRLAVAVAVVGLVPIAAAVTTLPERAIAAEHAQLWDAEDRQIRAARDAGQADVVVPQLPTYFGLEFVTPDRANWFNVCVARYYGVRSIASS